MVDASPLIVFQEIHLLDLLHRLYDPILIPSAVAREVHRTIDSLPRWINVVQAPEPPPTQAALRSLDPGEREAIALSLVVRPRFFVVDDRDGRRVAQALHIPVVGSLGVLIQAKEKGLIRAVQPLADRLVVAGLYVAPEVYRQALILAKE